MKAKKSSLENRMWKVHTSKTVTLLLAVSFLALGAAAGTGAEVFKFAEKGDWTIALTFADGSHPYEAKITIERDECVIFIR